MGIDRFGMSLADRRMPALEETVDLPGLFDLEGVELPGVWLWTSGVDDAAAP